jgi:catechol-2,3-dioxygenase
VQPSASGRPAVFTQDPDGNVIELSQQWGHSKNWDSNKQRE